jgi:hypothetical protein
MRARRIFLVAGLVALAGCGSSTAKPRAIGTADAYLAIVTWELGQLGPPATDASLPIVYIATEDGKSIDAGAQAKVVKAIVQQAKVRFTDVRDDAIDTQVTDAPVKDGGVMLIVDKLDDTTSSRLEVPIIVYHNKSDQQRTTLTMVSTDGGATVTSASAQPSG